MPTYTEMRDYMKTIKIKQIGFGLLIPVIIVLAWYLSTTFGSVPPSLLPGLSKVGNTFLSILQSGRLVSDLSISLSRVVKGYLLSVAIGVTLGSIMGMSSNMRYVFQPIVTVIRQIPMIAWIPLIILWAGIGEASKVIVIVIAAVFPILVNTLSGISSTSGNYVEVAKLYKLSKWKTFIRVYLPHALPQILVGLKLGLGVSWMAVVASELIASTSGIGYRMSDARSLMQSDVVIICMIVIGLLGIIMDKGLSILFSLFTPWKKLEKSVENN